jgi:hypothetical protein
MTDAITRLMQANLFEVFNQRDTELRRAAITRTFAPDARWTDDDGVTVGHAELDAKAVDLSKNSATFSSSQRAPSTKLSDWGIWPGTLSTPVVTPTGSRGSTLRSCETMSSSISTR